MIIQSGVIALEICCVLSNWFSFLMSVLQSKDEGMVLASSACAKWSQLVWLNIVGLLQRFRFNSADCDNSLYVI